MSQVVYLYISTHILSLTYLIKTPYVWYTLIHKPYTVTLCVEFVWSVISTNIHEVHMIFEVVIVKKPMDKRGHKVWEAFVIVLSKLTVSV